MTLQRALDILDRILGVVGFGLVAWVLVLLVMFLGGCAAVQDPPGVRRGCICVLASCDCSVRECPG